MAFKNLAADIADLFGEFEVGPEVRPDQMLIYRTRDIRNRDRLVYTPKELAKRSKQRRSDNAVKRRKKALRKEARELTILLSR